MKITQALPTDMYDGCMSLELTTEAGTNSVNFGSGEPEDMCLARDLNDALNIKALLIMAYNAGLRGEILEIEDLEENEE